MKRLEKIKKLRKIYSFIKENLYYCEEDLLLKGYELNSTLLFSLLAGVVGGKVLIYGEYGMGKTTVCENVISLLYSVPVEVVMAASIKGHAEQTEEKMIARPDLGKLNKGIEKNKWQYSILLKPKLIDEFNRLPCGKQNILLEGIDRGIWKYLNETIYYDMPYPLFATCNFKDAGNNELIPPILDRFDVAVESKRMGVFDSRKFRSASFDSPLSNMEITRDIFEVFNKVNNPDEVEMSLEIHRHRFRKYLKDSVGLELFTSGELKEIRDEMKNIKLTFDANLFLDFFITEISCCRVYGAKRGEDRCIKGCHFNSYACSKTKNGISMRAEKTIIKLAQAVAWFLNEKEIDAELLHVIIPYFLWHRLNFNPGYVNKFGRTIRKDPLKLCIAKTLIFEVYKRFSRMKQYLEIVISENDPVARNKILEKMEHPVFKQYEKAIYTKKSAKLQAV